MPSMNRTQSAVGADANRGKSAGASQGGYWMRLPALARFGIIAVATIGLWQLYLVVSGVSELLVSPPAAVAQQLVTGWGSDGALAVATLVTLKVLFVGVLIGSVIAISLTVWAAWSSIGSDVLDFFGSILSPLPGIAILPLAMLWFGISQSAVVFVVVNAVIWPLAFNLRVGIRSISPTILAVSKNIGLGRSQELTRILLPASLPYIIAGFRTAWAFGWRTVVAAEIVFGIAGSGGGLGYFLNNARYFLRIPDVFASLVTIAIIGILLEVCFSVIERLTVRRWGMQIGR